jgi:hypothetical protein
MVEEMVQWLGKKKAKRETRESDAGDAVGVHNLTRVKAMPRVRPRGMTWLRKKPRKRPRETAWRKEKPSVRWSSRGG